MENIHDVEVIGKVIPIPREKIRPFANQPRTYFNKAKLNELAESIRENGQQVPIFVKELESHNGSAFRYELIDGQRRWHACDIAGVTKMKAIVLDVKDEDEQFTISVICNFGRVGHTPVETALAIRRFRETKTVAEIARIFARSEAWVYQHLKILRLTQEVLDMMSPELPEEEQIPFSTAVLLADLPADSQNKMANMVRSNKLKSLQARNAIRREAKKLGITAGSSERTPNKDYVILCSLVGKLKRDLDIFLGMPQGMFDKMFEHRDAQQHANLLERIEMEMRNLKVLHGAVKKAKK